MRNPFIAVSDITNKEYITPRVSLNRAVLAKSPLPDLEPGIEGKRFSDIFSTKLISAEIRRLEKVYGVDLSEYDDASLPRVINRGLVTNDIKLSHLAERIAVKFGNRLGLLLLALKRGEKENRLARPEWDDECWAYWRNVRTVILTGGLSSSMLGRRFKERIQYVFDMAREEPYDIMLFENGAYLGIMGLAQRLMKDESAALALDLGQTNIKRAVVKKGKGEIAAFSPMETLPSQYMQADFDSEEERLRCALLLRSYLLNAIVRSYREGDEVTRLSDKVLISIASYTYAGILDDRRSGYAKLSLLSDNFEKLLSEELSSELHKEISVRLVHDGTATALYFSDVPDSVCVTLGTAFGVGFPNIRI